MAKKIKPWLVVISAGRWQVSGIHAAIKQGVRVLALDGDPNAEGLKIATKSVVVDIKNPDAVLSSIKSVEIIPNGVVSFASEVGMMSAAAVREYYNLTGPSINLTRLLTNKAYQRELWDKKGVYGPKWAVITSLAMAKNCIKDFEIPCIVKPVDSSGSRGVTRVDNLEDFEDAILRALKSSISNTVLIESFLEGNEFTVETFGDGKKIHVLAVTEKKKLLESKGVVAKELYTVSNDLIAKNISDAAVKAIEALNYYSGPGHTEIIVDKNNNPGLVEVAGRGGGFMVFEGMVKKVTGFDIVTATVMQSIGVEVQVNIEKKRSSVLRFISSKKGRVGKISGFKEANSIQNVDAGVLVSPGQLVNNVHGDGDRLAYILSVGKNINEAKVAADYAEKLIKINIGDK